MYDPSKYPNPSLQWFYRILQAMALDEDIPQKPDDKTLPKYRQIDKRVGLEVDGWKKELERSYQQYTDDNPDIRQPAGSKRGASNGEQKSASKRVKTEPGEAISEEHMRRLWQQNALASLTVPQLKDFCNAKKLIGGGKKADIVERIEGWFEEK
jgi:ATP-dependent DNA helicase 2 subunit 1